LRGNSIDGILDRQEEEEKRRWKMTSSTLAERINSIDISVQCISKRKGAEMDMHRLIRSFFKYLRIVSEFKGLNKEFNQILSGEDYASLINLDRSSKNDETMKRIERIGNLLMHNYEELRSIPVFNKTCWYSFMKTNAVIREINDKIEDILDNYYLVPELKKYDEKLLRGDFKIIVWDEYQKQKINKCISYKTY
jgi:hypothetical protein